MIAHYFIPRQCHWIFVKNQIYHRIWNIDWWIETDNSNNNNYYNSNNNNDKNNDGDNNNHNLYGDYHYYMAINLIPSYFLSYLLCHSFAPTGEHQTLLNTLDLNTLDLNGIVTVEKASKEWEWAKSLTSGLQTL